MLEIKTNHNWRQFKYRDEVPKKVMADRFDYMDDDTIDGFFCYRGWWYHLDDFMRTDTPNSPLAHWHGYTSDSFFSGVVIRISDDCETYQIGTYIS